MSRLSPYRLLAALMALALGLVWALPTTSQAAPLNQSASTKAGNFIASKLTVEAPGKKLSDASGTADAIVALVAAGGHDADVAALDAWLKANAAAYATTSGAAGKVAIAAAAAGSDPTAYGAAGDLTAKIVPAAADGRLTAYGDAFNQALGVLGLLRSGRPVPPAVATYLISIQYKDGSFGYEDSWNSTPPAWVADADSTGLALQALAGLAGSNPAAKAAAVKARDYLATHRTAEGYWANPYSPANTAGLAGGAMVLVGSNVTTAAKWLAGQQRPDGALPSTLNGTDSNLFATLQGMMLFAGESYLSVGPGGIDKVVLPATSPSAPTTTTTTTTKPAVSSTAPAPVAKIMLSATTVQQGNVISVTGKGFTSAVQGTLNPNAVDLGSQKPNDDGAVTFTIETKDLALGEHTVTLTARGAKVSATFTVTSSVVLADTGAEVPPAAIAGAVIVLIAGMGLVVAGRRRAQ